jgi:hypothetical protein
MILLQKYLAVLIGTHDGKPVYFPVRAICAENEDEPDEDIPCLQYDAPTTLEGPVVGILGATSQGKPAYDTPDNQCGDDCGLGVGQVYHGLLIGYIDGKPVYAVSCETCLNDDLGCTNPDEPLELPASITVTVTATSGCFDVLSGFSQTAEVTTTALVPFRWDFTDRFTTEGVPNVLWTISYRAFCPLDPTEDGKQCNDVHILVGNELFSCGASWVGPDNPPFTFACDDSPFDHVIDMEQTGGGGGTISLHFTG